MELIVENLACARGGIPVLENVSFVLRPGHILALRGPNGIGKTTLLRTIAGLQPALSGHISPDADQVAFAPHADGLKPTLTVRENLSFWAGVYGTDPGETDTALAAFGLAGLAGRRAAYLSAGQKRRLALARLLLTGRALWALDEPTVSLDDAGAGLFARMVTAHCAQGGLALIATHGDAWDGAEVLDLTGFRAVPPACPAPDGPLP